MSRPLVALPIRVLHFVLWVATVESLSSTFIDVGRHPLQVASRRQLCVAPSINSRQSFVSNFFPAASSTACRRRQSIFSLKQQQQQQQYEEGDDGYDDFPSPKLREMSEKEIPIRRMAKNPRREFPRPRKMNDNAEDDYAEETNGRMTTYDNSFDEDVEYDDFYEDDDFDEEGSTAGNFWSNPKSSVDNPPVGIARRGRQRQQRRYYDDEDDYDDDMRRSPRRRPPQSGRQRPSRRRSSAPPGLGQPSKVVKDFYSQLFWYGFDADDTAKVGDNTIFGGTKGKFNGFNYLLSESDEGKNGGSRSPNNSARRLPPSRNGSGGAITRNNGKRPRRDVESDYYYDDYDDDEDYERDYDGFDDSSTKRKPSSSTWYTPPTDRTSTRKDSVDGYDDYEDDGDEYTDDERLYRENSSRYNEQDEYMDRRSGGRRRRRQQNNIMPNFSPLGMIENFLGIDREEMDYQADLYNAKMGIRKRRRSPDQERQRRRVPRERRSARDDPERQGYAYRYDATEDDETTPILDIDLADDEDSEVMNSDSRLKQLSQDVDDNDERRSRRNERSWEERQIAMERVPPVDIMAWGPSGELGMSAREKAFMDAQEDIETARRNLNLTEKKESEIKEELSILNVDAERQRLKLSESPRERRSRRDIEELRQIEMDIDDAARDLRRSRLKVGRALDKLEDLEERHHAIMSCYNIDQASLLVGESLNQFSASIPATTATTSTSTSTASETIASEEGDSKANSTED